MSDPRRFCYSIVAHSAQPNLLDDGFGVTNTIRKIAVASGMRILDLMSVRVEEQLEKMQLAGFHDEGGLSITAIISTSHIAFHGWPARGVFMFDLVSCRPFDFDVVNGVVAECFCVDGVRQISRRNETSASFFSDVDVDFSLRAGAS
jgi:S-adenosylmethionine/arginine decarboxylase-like enzyme